MGSFEVTEIPVDSLHFRKGFHNATKEVYETVHDWYTRLKTLAEYCRYGNEADTLILDKLIVGLDERLFDRLCQQVGYLSLEQSLRIARQFEEEATVFQNNIKIEYVEAKEELVDVLPENDTIFTAAFISHENIEEPENLLCELKPAKVEKSPIQTKRKYKPRKSRKVDDAANISSGGDENAETKVPIDSSEHYRSHVSDVSQSQVRVSVKPEEDFLESRECKPKRIYKTKSAYECDYCHEILSLKVNLERHLLNHYHRRCQICSREYSSVIALQIHMAKCHGASPVEPTHICHVCGKKFTRPSFLAVHLKIHSGVRPFSCEYCDKTFVCSAQLSRHITVHTKEKRYVCSICDKRFARPTTLASHTQVHTGNRPFLCTAAQCGKRFYNASHLKRHFRIHSGERPYKCDFCDKSFNQSSTLKCHIKIHSRGTI